MALPEGMSEKDAAIWWETGFDRGFDEQPEILSESFIVQGTGDLNGHISTLLAEWIELHEFEDGTLLDGLLTEAEANASYTLELTKYQSGEYGITVGGAGVSTGGLGFRVDHANPDLGTEYQTGSYAVGSSDFEEIIINPTTGQGRLIHTMGEYNDNGSTYRETTKETHFDLGSDPDSELGRWSAGEPVVQDYNVFNESSHLSVSVGVAGIQAGKDREVLIPVDLPDWEK